MKGRHRVFVNATIAAVMAITEGCAYYGPIAESEKAHSDISYKVGADLAYEQYKLGNKIQTTPVDPADAGFLSGETTTDLDKGYDVGLVAGVVGSTGLEWLRLRAGVDARFNISSLTRGQYRTGSNDTRQQSTDTRPPSSGSFVYTQFSCDPITLIPYVGLDLMLLGGFFVGGEVGIPYSGSEVQSGQDRWAEWKANQKDHWGGQGIKYGIKIGIAKHDEDLPSMALKFEKESYLNAEFGGEKASIDRISLVLEARKTF